MPDKITFPKRRKMKTLGKSKPASKKPVTKSQVKHIAKKAINREAEKKFILISPSPGNAFDPTAPLLNLISTTATGDNAPAERTGNKINPTSMKFSYTVSIDGSVTTSDVVRVIVVQYMRDVNTNPLTTGYVLQDVTNNPVHSPYSQTASRLFTVLYDVKHTLYRTKTLETTHVQLNKLKFIRYDTGANLGVGEIYIMCFSAFATAANPAIITYCSNIRYTDF